MEIKKQQESVKQVKDPRWQWGNIRHMCVVFLCITATHGNDESPLAFAIDRIIDTAIGILIALFINQFPKSKM